MQLILRWRTFAPCNQKKYTVDFEGSIAPWLGKTSKIIDYHIHDALQEHGLDLSKEQMIVLKKLHDKDGLAQNDLAFLTLRNKSTLTRLLVKMERKGFITREQSATDKRSNHVYLTEAGKEIYKKTRPLIKNIISAMEQNLTQAEKAQIIEILKKVQFNLTAEKAFL